MMRGVMMRGEWHARGREDGFALLAAIWFAAVSALVAVIVAGWMTRSLGLAARLQDRLAAHSAIISAQNEVAFRMLAGFFSTRGLELPHGAEREQAMAPEAIVNGFDYASETSYLRLDDRPYRLGDAIIRLQDDRGLYTLNHPDPAWLNNLLRDHQVRYEERSVLLDRLLGYQDKSALYRLNGAVAADYVRAGRPPPRQAPLLTPWEALRVLSWDAYPALWRGPDALPNLTTIGDTPKLNPNTAPAAILRSLPGMTEAAVERVIKYRERYAIQSSIDLDRAAEIAVAVDPFEFYFFPAADLRVTILAANNPLVHRVALRLTPIAAAPYRVDYAVDLPADEQSRALAAKPV
jgi:hypothetical protein